MVMTKYKVTITNRDNVEYEADAKRSILDELRNQGVDLPYGCKYGGCITCAAKLTSGDVDQKRQVALIIGSWITATLFYALRGLSLILP